MLLPPGVDDPGRPSGGNVYDRRVCQGLTAAGWCVLEHPVAGRWPCPDTADRAVLAGVLDALPDGAVLLADGLVACAAPAELRRGAGRLRIVILLHMPFGERSAGRRADESAVLAAAAAVVTTSTWTREWLLDHYPLGHDRVHVAQPGVDDAPIAPGTPDGGRLLCVAAVTAAKGYDVLAAALAEVRDLSWRCECVGVTDDRRLVDELTGRAHADGIADRLRFTGPLAGAALSASYATADVLVLPSRRESFGMVVVEALARGLPVIASSVGGVPEALGTLPGGRRAGILVPPGDAGSLGRAVRRWLDDDALRTSLRAAARERRAGLTGWAVTTGHVARALAEVA